MIAYNVLSSLQRVRNIKEQTTVHIFKRLSLLWEADKKKLNSMCGVFHQRHVRFDESTEELLT